MEYHLLSDELLIRLLRVDDQGAFNEIYKRYWKTLFKAAQHKIRSEEIIEELLQNVFLRIWEKRASQQIDNLGGYIFNALKYQIVDHYRTRLLEEKYADFKQTKTEEYQPSPEDTVNFKDIKTIFDSVLQRLPEKTGRIYQLSRLELKTTREISQLLDIPERTVEYHITQSLKLLRQHLKDFLPTWIIVFLWNI